MTRLADARSTVWVALLAATAMALAGCGGSNAAPDETTITMARVDDSTQWFQAEVHRQLLIDLGYQVTSPDTVAPNTFYPRLASGQYDLWADGWFPNHDPYLTEQDITGGTYDTDVTPLERDSDLRIVQGYMVDEATADDLGITSIEDLGDPAVAEVFDRDGDGKADLVGCNEGWGCNLTTEEQIAAFDWGDNVNHVVGDFFELFDDVIAAHEAGRPVLFYNWLPNWTVEALVPGEDVRWLQAPALPDDTDTDVSGLASCDADPCDLGFSVNKVVSVANTGFIDDHPDIQALLEVVDVPAEDISPQVVEMQEAQEYSSVDLEDAARAWINDHQDTVDGWLDTARAAR